MGLNLKDLFGENTENSGEGITLDELMSIKTVKKIDCKTYLDFKKDWIDINNCYIIDSETYRLNSQIRCIQCYNTQEKKVYFIYYGGIEKTVNNRIIQEIKKLGFEIEFVKCDSEEMIIRTLLQIIYEKPKTLVGHNLTHFDLGLIHSKMQKYNCVKDYKIYLKGYKTGSGDKQRFAYFTYLHEFNNDKKGKRYKIVDTMLIAQTLTIPSSLAKISVKANSKFPKKKVDYRVFENEEFTYDSIIYSIYDVLGIIDVYKYLLTIIDEISQKYLKIERRATQGCYEHLWMKGAGSLAEAFLKNFLGRINPNTPDYLTKYYGGLCRVWNFDLVTTKETKEKLSKTIMRELDFTSAYPFNIFLQGIFDILNGNYEYFQHTPIKHDSEIYRKLIYSSTLVLKVKQNIDLLFECDMSKNSGMIGIGYLRSFDKQNKVQELQHTLGILRCEGKTSNLPSKDVFKEHKIKPQVRERLDLEQCEKVLLTKTELEMNLVLNPQLFESIELLYIQDGLIPTSFEKSKEYIELFRERMKLQSEKNPAEYGIKRIFVSQYGKLAQGVSDFFNLACASAITGFQRFQIFATCIFALKIQVEKLSYTDTDSLYVKTTMEKLNQIVDYAETLNPYPMELFGVNNLKIEKDRIICFHPIKRKRYLKIYYNEKGELVIKIKGENGNSDYRWRDVFFRLSLLCGGKTTITEIQECIKKRDFEIKLPISKRKDEKGEETTHFEYLQLFEEIYEHYQGEEITKIIPELDSKAVITMQYNVHFKTSIQYENGIYYDKIRRAWESQTNEKAYVGCFFSINRKIEMVRDEQGNKVFSGTFNHKTKEECNFQINLETYESVFDVMPIMLNKVYNQILAKPINLDTIVLKTSHPLPLWILDSSDSKSITYSSFNSPHNGKRWNSHLSNPSLFIKLRLKTLNVNLKELPEIEEVKKGKIDWEKDREDYEKYFPYVDFIKKDISREKYTDGRGKKKEKKTYVNTHLFIQNIVRFESVVRVNKFRLFCENPNIFNVYRTINKLANLMQITIERMFELRGIQIETNRFLFTTQIDICQVSSKEFHHNFWKGIYDKPFKSIHQGHFIQADFCKYLSLSCYNKTTSALNKIHYYNMLENEKKYFLNESIEGYRSEIKFRLQRNYFESLSYAYMLNLINQEYFLQFIRDFEKIKSMKEPRFKISSLLSGKLKFNAKQVLLLFKPFDYYKSDLITLLKSKVEIGDISTSIQEYPSNTLDDRGLLLPPPQISQNVTNKKINAKLKIFRQKNKVLDESTIQWGIKQEDFDYDTGKSEEILFSELFSRF